MSKAEMDFSQRLTRHKALIEAHLQKCLHEALANSAPSHQSDTGRLAAAMQDSTLSGGKRLRPILVMECAALFGVPVEHTLNTAAAIEFVHCYSLVHDDLPCMDNDALRRGQPTIWKAYDEWTAVLAGDGLLTLAFETLAQADTHPEATVRLDLISTLARASGGSGMVQGQALDLAASKLNQTASQTAQDIFHLQALKTGALIEASCEMGARLGNAEREQLNDLKTYGAALGLAFQIRDDLLDQDGTMETVGKATGKDLGEGKATLVALLGRDAAQHKLTETVQKAHDALARFSDKAKPLCQIAKFVADREH